MNAKELSETRRSYPSDGVIWLAGATFVVLGAIALFTLPNVLLNNWFPGSDESERRKLLASAAQIILFSLGGIIAVVGVALSLSRHGQQREADQRERAHADRLQEVHESEMARARQQLEDVRLARTREAERELRARFVSAVELLSSSESATRRVAGMHALGALADDWLALDSDEQTQVSIDMLCTYLRTPPGTYPTAQEEKMVRRVGFDIIRSHLLDSAETSWSRFSIRLANVHIDFDADLSYIRISQGLDLRGMTIASRGRLRLNNITLDPYRKIALRGAALRGNAGLDLSSSTLQACSSINMRGVQIGDKANIYLRNLNMYEDSDINLLASEIEGDGRIHLRGSTLRAGSVVRVRGDLKWTAALGAALSSRDLPTKSTQEREFPERASVVAPADGPKSTDRETPRDTRTPGLD